MVKILIVEDDPLMVRMYSKAFQLSSYEVETAFDGEEAVNKLQKMDSKPTLILCDVMMPKMNGLDVLRQIKKDDNLKKIPVIMLTNLAGEEDAEKALSLGAIAYLVKSEYDPKQVVAKVKEVIAGYTRGVVPESKVSIKDVKSEKKSSKK